MLTSGVNWSHVKHTTGYAQYTAVVSAIYQAILALLA